MLFTGHRLPHPRSSWVGENPPGVCPRLMAAPHAGVCGNDNFIGTAAGWWSVFHSWSWGSRSGLCTLNSDLGHRPRWSWLLIEAHLLHGLLLFEGVPALREVQPPHDNQLGLGPAAPPASIPIQPFTGAQAQLVGRLTPTEPRGPRRYGDVPR